MNLHDILLSNASFAFKENIFYQKELSLTEPFERNYLELRQRENRVYSDEIVRNLPGFDGPYSQKKEWMLRKITLTKLIAHFKSRRDKIRLLELGCGNGWLSHRLAISLNADIFGLDINEMELRQGARLFSDCRNLTFIHGDIFTVDIRKESFDIILLPSSIQYFPDLRQLLNRLLELLKPDGEIHIVDSPIYKSSIESQEAKRRSFSYFNGHGVPSMKEHYFHHSLLDLREFNYRILFRPNQFVSMFNRIIPGTPQPVFPWILIKPH